MAEYAATSDSRDLEGREPAGGDLAERQHLVGGGVEEPGVVELALRCLRQGVAWPAASGSTWRGSVPIDTRPRARCPGPARAWRSARRGAAARSASVAVADPSPSPSTGGEADARDDHERGCARPRRGGPGASRRRPASSVPQLRGQRRAGRGRGVASHAAERCGAPERAVRDRALRPPGRPGRPRSHGRARRPPRRRRWSARPRRRAVRSGWSVAHRSAPRRRRVLRGHQGGEPAGASRRPEP